MSYDYRTCTHTYDSGRACKSAAVTGRDFCGYHLRYRGRLLRMAQYRARHQRFDITLPPLDSLCSIQSALSQVAEALAADMIDPRRAQGLLKALRFAKENLKDSAHWHDTPYLTEDATAYDNFESDYGLPDNLDLSVPPEVSFPPPPEPVFSDLSSRAERSGVEEPALSLPKGPAFSPDSSQPYVRDYEAEAQAAFEVQPEDIELQEIMKKYGYKAWEERSKEHQRNQRRRRQRKYFRANYARFEAEAKAKNIQRAAEKLMREKLAAELAEASKKLPTSTSEPDPQEVKNTA
jgi:hypothetical protein